MEEVIVQEKKLLVSKLSLSLVSVLFKPSPWSGLQPPALTQWVALAGTTEPPNQARAALREGLPGVRPDPCLPAAWRVHTQAAARRPGEEGTPQACLGDWHG